MPFQQCQVLSQEEELENELSSAEVYNKINQKRSEEHFSELFHSESHNMSSSEKRSHHSSIISESNSNIKFNTGRWTPQEHSKFIEAIFIYGNDWKRVQQHIKTRSPAQARSHAQKFFIRLRKRFQEEFHDESSIADQQEKILEWLKEMGDPSVLNSFLATEESKGKSSHDSDIIVSERKDKLCKLILSMCTSQNTRIKRSNGNQITCEKMFNFEAFANKTSLSSFTKDLTCYTSCNNSSRKQAEEKSLILKNNLMPKSPKKIQNNLNVNPHYFNESIKKAEPIKDFSNIMGNDLSMILPPKQHINYFQNNNNNRNLMRSYNLTAKNNITTHYPNYSNSITTPSSKNHSNVNSPYVQEQTNTTLDNFCYFDQTLADPFKSNFDNNEENFYSLHDESYSNSLKF
jgi:SHAQKYF class myb-like DNA-binding protein